MEEKEGVPPLISRIDDTTPLSETERSNFREAYTALFANTATLEATPAIKANPLYAVYQRYAKRFYHEMLSARRKYGMRT
jgi:hypothetical protein